MSSEKYPSTLADRFIVRLPDGMRDQIAGLAKKNNRSMNAEIVARLQQSLESGPVAEMALELGEEATERMRRIEKRLDLVVDAILSKAEQRKAK